MTTETEAESFGAEAFEAPQTIRRMLVTTWALLYSLDPAQRQHCQFPMDDPGRLDWDFIPKPRAPNCSSSSTTPSTAATTSTRCGVTTATTSATTCSPSTTGASVPPATT
jgi:hypothetical protein